MTQQPPSQYTWDDWAVTATEAKSRELLDHLDQSLPAGWYRLSDRVIAEERRTSPDTVRWYRIDPPHANRTITLGIELRPWGELRGGALFTQYPYAWDVVEGFLSDGLFPVAERVGATYRRTGARGSAFDKLPWDVRDALLDFLRRPRKGLPLEWDESEAWQAFIVAAYRTATAFDHDVLRGWLTATGWTEPDASELTRQFFEQCRLLSRYHDTLVIA